MSTNGNCDIEYQPQKFLGVKKLGTGGMDAIKQINWPDQKSKVVMDES